MSDIVRRKGDFHPLEFEMDLRSYGKTLADIDEITFSIKDKLTDEDDSLFKKLLSTGKIVASGTDVVSIGVEWLTTEYSNLTIGKKYKAGLFATFTGDPVADENVDKIFSLEIEQDFLHE